VALEMKDAAQTALESSEKCMSASPTRYDIPQTSAQNAEVHGSRRSRIVGEG
jgi:hypothetical protein